MHLRMFRIPPLSCVFALVLALGASSFDIPTAHAQSDDARQTAAARSLFQEGVTFADSAEWASAADRFERAFALRASPNIENNLALAYEQLGRLIEAVERFRHVVQTPGVDRRVRDAARQRIRALEPRIGRLVVRVDGNTEGVALTLDGRAFPEAAVGVATPVDPGARTLLATRAGTEVGRIDVTVPEGGEAQATLVISAQLVANVTLPPAPEGSSRGPFVAATSEPESDSVAKSPWLWIGVGVAAVAIGVTTAILVMNDGAASPVEGNTTPSVLRF